MLKKTEPHSHRKFPLDERSIERAEKDPWSVDMGTIQSMADHIRALEGAIESILWATEDWEVVDRDDADGRKVCEDIVFSAPGIPSWEDIRTSVENLLLTRGDRDDGKAAVQNGNDG